MSTGKQRGRPKGGKDTQPRPQPASKRKLTAEAVINDVTAGAGELQMPIRELVARAFRAAPEPDIDPSALLKKHMLRNPRVFLWAMEHFYGKPPQHLESAGTGRGPIELNVVIERIGGKQ